MASPAQCGRAQAATAGRQPARIASRADCQRRARSPVRQRCQCRAMSASRRSAAAPSAVVDTDAHNGKADDPGRRRAAHDPRDGGQGGAGHAAPRWRSRQRCRKPRRRGCRRCGAERNSTTSVASSSDCDQQDDHELRRHQHEAPLRDAASEGVVHGADLDQPLVEHDRHHVDHRRRRADDPGDVAGPIMKGHIVRKRLKAEHQDRELKGLEAERRSRTPSRPRSTAGEQFAPDASRELITGLPLPGQGRAGEQLEQAPWRMRRAGRWSACRPRCPDS